MKKLSVLLLCAMLMTSAFGAIVSMNVSSFEPDDNSVMYTPHAPIKINSNVDFTAANGVIGGNGTEANPWIIEGWDIDGSGVGTCIYVGNTTDYFEVRDCYLHSIDGFPISSSYMGFDAYLASNGAIINVTSSINDYGLRFRYCNNMIVSNNTISNNDPYGIQTYYLGNSIISYNNWIDNGDCMRFYYADFNSISNNNLIDNQWGITIYTESNNNIISNNSIHSGVHGISLAFASTGENRIENNDITNANRGILIGSSNNFVENNTVSNSFVYGIYIDSSDNNNILKNTLINNIYGIYLSSSNSNLIYHNNFNNNTDQAYDDSNNSWHNGYPSGGNYWSDYTGVDNYSGPGQNESVSDGIGDTPHGFTGAQDDYPFMTMEGWVGTGGFFWQPVAGWNLISVPMNVSAGLLTGGNFLASTACQLVEDAAVGAGLGIPGNITLKQHILGTNPMEYNIWNHTSASGVDFALDIDYAYWLFVDIDLSAEGVYVQATELELGYGEIDVGGLNTVTLGAGWTMLNPCAGWVNNSAWLGGSAVHMDSRGNIGYWSVESGILYTGGGWNGCFNIPWYGNPATPFYPPETYTGYQEAGGAGAAGCWIDQAVVISDSKTWDPATQVEMGASYSPIFYGQTDPGSGSANEADPLYYANGFMVWSGGGDTRYDIDYNWTDPGTDVPRFPEPAPQMTVIKTVDLAVADPGDILTYTIWFNNTGTDNADYVWVNDTLPAGVTYIADTAAMSPSFVSSMFVGQNLYYEFANLPPGVHSFDIIVFVDTAIPDGTILENWAFLNYTDPSGNGLPGSSDNAATIVSVPEIYVWKVVDQTIANPGDILQYTIFYNNTGTGTADYVWINDTWDSSVTYLGDTSGLVLGVDKFLVLNGMNFVFTNVTPGFYNFTIIVQIPATAVHNSVIMNEAALDYAVAAYPSQYVWANTTVIRPMITIEKAASATVAAPYDTLTYLIWFNNTGSEATNVWINDTLSPFVNYISDTALIIPEYVSSGVSGQSLWFNFTNVEPGSYFFMITVQVDSGVFEGMPLSNYVELIYTIDNGLGWSDSDTAITLVAMPIMDITKSVNPSVAYPDDIVIYTITIENTGSLAAPIVWVNDTLPDEVTYIADSSGQIPWNSGNDYRWTFYNVPAGTNITFNVWVIINANTPEGVLVNNVWCNYTLPSGNVIPGGSDTAFSNVIRPMITMEKMVDMAVADQGDELIYTIYYNNTGNGIAADVWIDDTLPDGVTYITSGVLPYYINGSNIGWRFTNVAPGPHSFSFLVSIQPSVPNGTLLTNWAFCNYSAPNDLLFEETSDNATTLIEVHDLEPPEHSNENPAIDGYSSNLTPVISVDVTDLSGVNANTIKLYVSGFNIFKTLSPIADGFRVSYWHEGGFSEGEVVTCRIVADDIYGNTLDFTWTFTVGVSSNSFNISLTTGWNFISLPLVQTNTSIQSVLSSIDGMWDCVMYFDAADINDHWKSYDIYKPAVLNDLWDLDHTMGFWLHMTNDTTLTVNGMLPVNVDIQLHTGWNMVGYPVQDDSNYTVGDLKLDTGADIVEGYNSSALYGISVLPDSYILKKGEAYWVHVLSDSVWSLTNAQPHSQALVSTPPEENTRGAESSDGHGFTEVIESTTTTIDSGSEEQISHDKYNGYNRVSDGTMVLMCLAVMFVAFSLFVRRKVKKH